jgi:hypothetical protein
VNSINRLRAVITGSPSVRGHLPFTFRNTRRYSAHFISHIRTSVGTDVIVEQEDGLVHFTDVNHGIGH